MAQKLLFIGNSYTYYHDMPHSIFAPMAAAAGLDLEVQAVTRGGYTLSQFADPADEEGQRLRSVIGGQNYTWVVLQDHSLRTVLDPEGFFDGIRRLKELLAGQTDHFVLYATWGRKPGCETLTEIGMTNPQMTAHIAEKYDEAGARFGMTVAHVGRAFLDYARENPGAELYFEDLHHSSRLGSTVAARTILAALPLELKNERLRVTFAGSPANQRFDNTAVVSQVVLDGKHPFCTREQVLPGRRTTGGMGLTGEFVLKGAAESTPAGEWFCKPGVGLLRQREDHRPYDMWSRYEVRPYPVTKEAADNCIVFRQVGGVEIEKRFRLEENRLILDISARNRLGKPILLREYQHNFLNLGAPVGEGWELELGCDRDLKRIEAATLRQGDEITLPSAVRLEGDRVIWTGGMEGKVLYHRSENTGGPARWTMRHRETGLTVSETTDLCPDRVDVWAVEHCVCPEFYRSFSLAPDEKAQWQRIWTFE